MYPKFADINQRTVLLEAMDTLEKHFAEVDERDRKDKENIESPFWSV